MINVIEIVTEEKSTYQDIKDQHCLMQCKDVYKTVLVKNGTLFSANYMKTKYSDFKRVAEHVLWCNELF